MALSPTFPALFRSLCFCCVSVDRNLPVVISKLSTPVCQRGHLLGPRPSFRAQCLQKLCVQSCQGCECCLRVIASGTLRNCERQCRKLRTSFRHLFQILVSFLVTETSLYPHNGLPGLGRTRVPGGPAPKEYPSSGATLGVLSKPVAILVHSGGHHVNA